MTIENEVTANGHSNGDGSRRTSLTTCSAKTDLIVFDFDETIVNCNSDTYIKPLANSDPGGLSAVYDSYYDDHDWTVCMRNVFAFLHKIGIRKEDYRKCLAQMPLVAEMKYLFDRLEEHRLGAKKLAGGCGGGGGRQYEAIIISDANTFFIEVALEQYRLKQLFRKVFTNGTSFDSAGCLQIEPYHHQNWCKLSGRNLCKGHVLKEYIANRASDGVRFDRISYVGDGANDLCPSLRLSAADLCFPRQGYPLHKLVSEKVKSNEMKAKMCPFTTGADIWNVLNNCH